MADARKILLFQQNFFPSAVKVKMTGRFLQLLKSN